MAGESLISVVIPCYQGEKTLAETLTSVREQHLQDWECVVVNVGSTDRGPEIARHFARRDHRFRVLDQPRGRAGAARNAGLGMAQGRYVHFLDADDVIYPSALEQLVEELQRSTDPTVVYSDSDYIDSQGERYGHVRAAAQLDFESVAQSSPFVVHSAALPRSLVNDVGGFDEKLTTCEDWDLWIRVARAGGRFKKIDSILAGYRKDPNPDRNSGDVERSLRATLSVLERIGRPDPRVKNPVDAGVDGLAPIVAGRIILQQLWLLLGWSLTDRNDDLVSEISDRIRQLRSSCQADESRMKRSFVYGLLLGLGRFNEWRSVAMLRELPDLVDDIARLENVTGYDGMMQSILAEIAMDYERLKTERDALKGSTSYRWGRMLTRLKPRWFPGRSSR